MKKPINIVKILVITLLSIIAIAAIVFLFFNLQKKEKSSNGEQIDITKVNHVYLLKTNDFNEIEKYADKNKLNIKNEDNIAVIQDVDVNNQDLCLYFNIDSSKKISSVSGEFDSFLKDFDNKSNESLSVLQQELARVFNFFSAVVEDDISNYSIFDEKGFPLDPEDEASFKKILVGSAKISITIKDKNETYWEIESEFDEKGDLYFRFYHSFDVYAFENIIPNNEFV